MFVLFFDGVWRRGKERDIQDDKYLSFNLPHMGVLNQHARKHSNGWGKHQFLHWKHKHSVCHAIYSGLIFPERREALFFRGYWGSSRALKVKPMRLTLCLRWCVNKSSSRPRTLLCVSLKWLFSVCSFSCLLSVAAQTSSVPLACDLRTETDLILKQELASFNTILV